jgi:hypothetical protein
MQYDSLGLEDDGTYETLQSVIDELSDPVSKLNKLTGTTR